MPGATAANITRRARSSAPWSVVTARASASASTTARAGSAGFLCEAFDYLRPQAKKADDSNALQTRTFYAKEKKSLAYVIAIMNMILHGIEAPNIIHTNTLAENVSGIRRRTAST